MLDAIKKCSHGKLPAYFEVMNEPDSAWPYLHWEQAIQFHKIVASKIRARFPEIKVGGPTKTGTVSSSNEKNFRLWQNVEQFMNMSLDNLDFFSYHPYNSLSVHGTKYSWAGANEARFVAFMDMVENYADIRKSRVVPLILSEYGLGRTDGIDAYHPSDWLDWAYVNQHNAHMFTYQNYRGFIDRAIGFLLSHGETLGQRSLHYSLFHRNGTEKNAAMAYKFWRHFNYHYKYLRVESQFDKHDRMISPLALADPTKGKVSVLLHNYAFSSTNVNLHFMNNLISTNGATSTCFYLNSHKKPVLAENVPLHMKNGNVNMHPDSSCIFTFNSHANLNSLGTIHESTYYGHEMKIEVKRHCAICILSCQGCEDSVQTHIDVDGTTSSMQYVKLRVAVSQEKQNGKFGNPTSTGVKVNNHSVTNYYRLFLSGRGHEDSLWEVYIYTVPTAFVKHGGNTVKLAFGQEQGHVTSVALVIGTS
ncbi:hypothetical protein FSP39_011815 [Pinctada imbricata]|uniref:Glycoside hydrolase family 5 domain-containing protein n=1 Tax=Pinctada imbricata TaxID=66713 RepID=A0AA89C5A7_PINIB|nr:hypothetical protein FSP39_011815 [Pinctada imbricata]